MKSRIVALALCSLVLALPVPGGAADQGCAWSARFDPAVFNTAFPDEAANYWFSVLPAAPGTTLTIKGQYPHARYMSFITYNAAAQSVDGLNDQRIDPDPGSTNPFLAGADRTVTNRDYTVTVVFGKRESDTHNVLYTEYGSKSAQLFVLIYRVFRADKGLDIKGGVPLPSITANFAGGASVEIPSCPETDVPDNGVNQSFADQGGAGSSGSHFPGEDPPRWHKFYNMPTGYVYGLSEQERTRPLGDAVTAALTPYTTTVVPAGGFFDNNDNNYMSAVTSTAHGAYIVVHGKLPTTPDTYDNAPVMGTGELRYWSFCTNEPLTQRFYACVADDQVKLDANGFYTIVISTKANKPANIDACAGVNWLPAGPLSTLLIMRNMLPSPTFAHAIQGAPLGGEAAYLADYYPATSYHPAYACS